MLSPGATGRGGRKDAWPIFVVGIGGNLGELATVVTRFCQARSRLERLPYVAALHSSSLYRSAPVGPVAEQPEFVNGAIGFELAAPVDPRAILADLLEIERALGRDRGRELAGGPRPIDLDLLIAGELVADQSGPPALVVPHPRLHQRAFALRPTADLLGDEYCLPGSELTVADCLAQPAVASQPVVELPPQDAAGW